jgi:putative intracellular protease/amidase
MLVPHFRRTNRKTMDGSRLMRILMILTSHSVESTVVDERSNALENFAAAYFVFRDAGLEVVLASPNGGLPALYPSRTTNEKRSKIANRFYGDIRARAELADTLRLDQVCADDFDALFYPGGIGTLWDLTDNVKSIALISAISKTGKPIGLVAHGPSALCHVLSNNGSVFVEGRRLTAASASEDKILIGERETPFFLEAELRRIGALYSSASDWSCYVVQDGMLITGQNSASVVEAAQTLITLMQS